jgi:hypothetical protein
MKMLRQTLRLALILLTAPTARATLLAYDGFDYPAGQDLAGQSGGFGWDSIWGNNGGAFTVVSSPGLSYPGLGSLGNAAATAPNQGATAGDSVTTYPRVASSNIYGIPGSTVYYSFLLQPDADFGNYGGINIGGGELFIGRSGNQSTYGIEDATTVAPGSVPVRQGVPALLVLRADFGLTGTDTFRLYSDPTLPGLEPALDDATLTLNSTTQSNLLYLNNIGGYTTDELRIGTTYADVTAVPEPVLALFIPVLMLASRKIGRR